ncbi:MULTISPECIES: LPXTG cell wall anchor domain-containing protein [unclassified Enterococcus]|uniref:leucine-rich repeat domain-containing protein n=1 Tax=unclassified Enterococcus TaxID=2608891 RepID=UPI001551E521|nr:MULTISPECIES: LPXTG cell wall anchor domain-containing protein [unclassified Enterococcus]MBS7575929.1 LPXTG cell wall anchor domain-containing protein [Enterococcus sp. MMGLQ5-2]MBS7583162.1 LPXTG cell wall anchor domain-containing protein [Enterococcus sp. MMGLQ5-1]NPD11022.1 LPXTG cell wall anchor domain-containing protein [Enterococcus sp. MMGLQ5-1]NPD35765.1 LPXTG cell wall anchor domain-containing protein [Enterococcus sp. MMGLQ5-2]
MKKLLVCLTGFALTLLSLTIGGHSAYADVTVDSAQFPDDNFRNYISLYIDTDQNGILSESEISGVTAITVSSQNISSLKGINLFTNIHTLFAENNSIISLDLTGLVNLQNVYASHNQISLLNISGLNNIGGLSIGDNQLTTIDLSELSNLSFLALDNNQLTSLDVNSLYNLQFLSISNNHLTSLDLQSIAGINILSPQTTNAGTYFNHTWQVDLKQLGLTADSLNRLTITTPDVTLDPITGIVTFNHEVDSSTPPTELSYQYATQSITNALMTVTVSLEPIATYTIQFNTDQNGTLVNAEAQILFNGSKLNIIPTPIPNNGYEFSHWTDSKGQEYTSDDLLAYIVSGDETFLANFKKIETAIVEEPKPSDEGNESANITNINNPDATQNTNKELPKTSEENQNLLIIVGITMIIIAGLGKYKRARL